MRVLGFLNHTVAVVLIVVGLLSGSLAVLREIQLMYWPAKATKKRIFWGFVRVAFVVSAVFLWTDEHSKVVELQSKLSASTIFLNCQSMPLPVSYPSNSVLNLIDAGTRTAGFGQWFPSTGWPPKASVQSIGKLIYRCELINYTGAPIFNVGMTLKVIRQKTVWDEHSRPSACIDAMANEDQPVVIPEVAPNGGTFAFYFYNSSMQCARLIPPDYVTLETLEQMGKPERVRVHLKLAKTMDMAMMGLLPMKSPN